MGGGLPMKKNITKNYDYEIIFNYGTHFVKASVTINLTKVFQIGDLIHGTRLRESSMNDDNHHRL